MKQTVLELGLCPRIESAESFHLARNNKSLWWLLCCGSSTGWAHSLGRQRMDLVQDLGGRWKIKDSQKRQQQKCRQWQLTWSFSSKERRRIVWILDVKRLFLWIQLIVLKVYLACVPAGWATCLYSFIYSGKHCMATPWLPLCLSIPYLDPLTWRRRWRVPIAWRDMQI